MEIMFVYSCVCASVAFGVWLRFRTTIQGIASEEGLNLTETGVSNKKKMQPRSAHLNYWALTRFEHGCGS